MAQLLRNPSGRRQTWVWSVGWEDILEKGYPLQYSDLVNSMDSIVHGVAESDMTEWLSLSLFTTQFSHSVVSDSLRPHGLQHARLPCPSPTPGVYSNSCPSSQWCHPTISSSVSPFFSLLQSSPASGSFPVSQFFVCIRWPMELQRAGQDWATFTTRILHII